MARFKVEVYMHGTIVAEADTWRRAVEIVDSVTNLTVDTRGLPAGEGATVFMTELDLAGNGDGPRGNNPGDAR